MYGKMKEFLAKELADIKAAGLYKNERIITTPQRADIKVNDGEDVLNFCANNYLGLSDNQRLINAAKEAMDTHGFGMSSVRFICGTQDLHKQLEAAISDYFKTEDTILYAACFDANGGLFEPLFTEEDASVRQNAIVMPMLIWLTWNVVCRKRRHSVIVLLLQMVYSRWMVMWLHWIRFVNWRKNMTRW